jgi:DNA-binding IclR family transcriptional regulator
VAVPLAWDRGPGSAAANVSLPTSRATDQFRDQLAARLREIARRVEAGMNAAAPFGGSR